MWFGVQRLLRPSTNEQLPGVWGRDVLMHLGHEGSGQNSRPLLDRRMWCRFLDNLLMARILHFQIRVTRASNVTL